MLILYTEEIKSKPGILRISPFQVAVSELHIHTVFHKVLLVYYDLIYLTFRKKHKACVLQQLIRENQRKKKSKRKRQNNKLYQAKYKFFTWEIPLEESG